MLERMNTLLYQKGYRPLDLNDTGVLIHETEQSVYIVTLSTYCADATASVYREAANRIVFKVASQYRKRVDLLNLVAVEDGMFDECEMHFVETLSNVWFVAKDTGQLYIFENQPGEFDGLHQYIENGMKEYCGKARDEFSLTYVNTGIVAVNVIYFLMVIFWNKDYGAVYDSQVMFRMGALNYESFVSGEWYKLFTSLFMHFGLSHLLNNMILLVYAGCQLEKLIGGLPYLLLYISTGVTGNLLSLWYYHSIGEYVVSAGASGAIFGVLGALMVILLFFRTRTAEITPKRLFFLATLTIYYGMSTVGIDNAAHIGGFLSGIFGGFLLSKVSQYGKLK